MKLPEIAFPARPNKQKKNQNCKIESVQTSKGFTTTTIVPLRSTNELEPWYHNNKSGALLIESSWDFLLRYPGLFDKRVPPLSTWTSSLSTHCPPSPSFLSPYAYSPRLRLPVLLPWLGFQFLPTLPYPWASSPSSSASFNQAFSPFPTLPISLTKIPSPLLLLTQTSVLSSLALSPPSKPPLVNTLTQAWFAWWDSKIFKNWIKTYFGCCDCDVLSGLCKGGLCAPLGWSGSTAKQKSLQEINQWKQRRKDPQEQFRKWHASWWWNGIVAFL